MFLVKPMKLLVDLRFAFAAAMAYVILSRVQILEQLFILESLPENKMFADGQSLKELDRLNSISINNNSPKWEQNSVNGFRVMALNCQYLRKNVQHIVKDTILSFADVVCFSETWLTEDFTDQNLKLDGFHLHTNSAGYGKGVATYYKENIFMHALDIK